LKTYFAYTIPEFVCSNNRAANRLYPVILESDSEEQQSAGLSNRFLTHKTGIIEKRIKNIWDQVMVTSDNWLFWVAEALKVDGSNSE